MTERAALEERLRPDRRGPRPPRGARRRPRHARPDPPSPQTPPPPSRRAAGGLRRGRGLPAQEVPLQPPEPPRAPAGDAEAAVRAEGDPGRARRAPRHGPPGGRVVLRRRRLRPRARRGPPRAPRDGHRLAAPARGVRAGAPASGGASPSRGARSSSCRGNGVGDPSAAAALLDIEPWDADRLCVRPRPGAESLRLAEETSALLSRERALEARVLAALSVPLGDALPALPRAGQGRRGLRPRARGSAPGAGGRADPPGPPRRRDRHRARPAPSDGGALREPRHAVHAARRDVRRRADRDLRVEHGRKDGRPEDARLPPARGAGGALRPGRALRHARLPPFPLRGRGTGARGRAGPLRLRLRDPAVQRGARRLRRRDARPLRRVRPDDELRRGRSAPLGDPRGARAAGPRVVALFSTHFRGVRRLHGVRYLRMGGLDRTRLDLPGPDGGDDADLAARIRHIDRQMRFCLEPDAPGERRSDAIAVARAARASPRRSPAGPRTSSSTRTDPRRTHGEAGSTCRRNGSTAPASSRADRRAGAGVHRGPHDRHRREGDAAAGRRRRCRRRRRPRSEPRRRPALRPARGGRAEVLGERPPPDRRGRRRG